MKFAKHFSHIFFSILCILIVTVLCMLGGYLFNKDIDKLIMWFGKKEFLSSNFAPIATLFSGLSAIATCYLLFIQISFSHKQKQHEQIQFFENHLFQIFSMRTEIIKSLKYNDGRKDITGSELFEVAYQMLNFYFVKYSKIKGVKYSYKYRVLDKFSPDLGMLVDEKGNDVVPDLLELTKMILDYIDEKTNFVLYPYYHNVYIALKMIDEFSLISQNEKDNYIRILRSQFSQFEFCLLYYHALTHEDKQRVSTK